MTLLGMPMGAKATGPVVAKVGDYVIGSTTVNAGGYQLTPVTKVTSTRYYYDATNYVLRTTVVWVGTQAVGNTVMAALSTAYNTFKASQKSIINNAGGWVA